MVTNLHIFRERPGKKALKTTSYPEKIKNNLKGTVYVVYRQYIGENPNRIIQIHFEND